MSSSERFIELVEKVADATNADEAGMESIEILLAEDPFRFAETYGSVLDDNDLKLLGVDPR
ncbi:MAG: hypothetical protein AAFP04_01690 [Myxococcota bacterium]